MRTSTHPRLDRRPTRRPAARALLERRRRSMDDSGMTLVELLIASTLLLVLLTSVMITMDMMNTVSNSVNAQTQEFEQALPALAPLQNLLRAEVEPAPYNNGVPQPAFASVGNFALTFYSDIGTAYNNVTSLGTTGGPAKIVAQEINANGNPVTSSSTCTTTSLCSFQVLQYLPVITNGVSTCPVAGQGGSACTYSNYKLLANVLGVTNNPNPTKGAIQPVFAYNVFDTGTGTGSNLTSTQVQTGLTCTAPAQGASVASSCPADAIQSVAVELMVSRKGAGLNGTADEQSVVYRYAESPGATLYPYQPCQFYGAC